MATNQVDIIIPTRGRGKLIEATLAAIRTGHYRDFTLWIVDQSDDDVTESIVARHRGDDARVRYVHTAPRGSSAARNLGVAQGNAAYVIFTDDDCVPEETWLGAMVGELARPETWAVFGRILPDELWLARDAPPSAVSNAIQLALKKTPERRVYQSNRLNLGFGHGANMGFARERFNAIGGFDEMLGAGGKFHSFPERDIGYRILARGGRIVYTPDALVHHRHWRDWDGVRRTYRNYAIGAGAAASKYLRCGDWGGGYVLAEWILDQGVRQVLSGLLKWHSWQKIEIGLLQIIFPWVGVFASLSTPVDRQKIMYREKESYVHS
jgi:GT2 family glycosyltransferase